MNGCDVARVSDHPRERANGASPRQRSRQSSPGGRRFRLAAFNITAAGMHAMRARKIRFALVWFAFGTALALAASAQDKPAVAATSYLLKADRVFDARSEQTH